MCALQKRVHVTPATYARGRSRPVQQSQFSGCVSNTWPPQDICIHMARSAANSPARPVCASLIKRFQLVSPYEHQSPETNIQLERRRASPSAAGRPVPSIRARKTARRLSRSKKPFGVGVHLSAWLDGIHFHAGTALNVPTAAARTGRGLCLPPPASRFGMGTSRRGRVFTRGKTVPHDLSAAGL